MLDLLSRLLAPVSALWREPGSGLAARRRCAITRDAPRCYTPTEWPQALYADLWRPRLAGPLPAILLVHGGAWRSGTPAQVRALARRLAQRGYLVANVSYRLLPEWRFPAPLEDLQQAMRWLRAEAATLDVDPERIGAWGYSSGAHLVTLLAAAGPVHPLHQSQTRPRAVVGGGTPADLRKFHGGHLVPDFLGERWSPESTVFRRASPAAWIDPDQPPVFLYHGARDRLVPPDQADDYHRALQAAGADSTLVWLRGRGHIGAFLLDHHAVQRGADFLDRHLRPIDACAPADAIG